MVGACHAGGRSLQATAPPRATPSCRDSALLDPNPATAEQYRHQLEESYHSAADSLKGYVPVADEPAEQVRIDRLRRELDEFRRTLFEVLSTDNREWAVRGPQSVLQTLDRRGVIS